MRSVRRGISHTYIEGFIQKESNHFISLENRELLGIGLRFNPGNQFFIGTGIMNEMEVYNNDNEQNFIKSTNYINYSVEIMDKITLQNILYYQFKLESFDNYRFLWDGKLSFLGSDWLSLYINYHYRYDVSNIINPDGSSYFEISNGLGFQF